MAVLADSGPFHGLLLIVLGSQSDFHGCRIPRCAYVSVINNHSLGRFWPVSWTITVYWGLGVISTIDEPLGAFTCRSLTLTIFADSGPFRGLLITILGSRKVILMVAEPQEALTCHSSTLFVLPDSGPFHGLLLTILGSLCDFLACRTTRSYDVQVIDTRRFD